MTYTVALSPKARDQLIALNAHIADAASPQVADRYTDAIADFCFSLATFPERGARRDDIRPGIRVTNYRKRVVVAFTVAPSCGSCRYLACSTAARTTRPH